MNVAIQIRYDKFHKTQMFKMALLDELLHKPQIFKMALLDELCRVTIM